MFDLAAAARSESLSWNRAWGRGSPRATGVAHIADQTARSFQDLVEKEGRVAFISHSTMGSAKHALVDKVKEGLKIAKETYPDLKCDGEMHVRVGL